MKFEETKKKAIEEWESTTQKKVCIRVGTATCGRSSGALDVLKAINDELSRQNIDANVMEVGCLGLCYIEPMIDIYKPGYPRVIYANVSPDLIPQLIEDYLLRDDPRRDLALGTIGEGNIEGIPRFSELPMIKPQIRLVLKNCGHIDPVNINHYIANGGFGGLIKALKMKPEEIIEEVKKSGLRGRGGAGFPTGTKWGFCRSAEGVEKYIICNADEGDPGAFMNRSLLEGDPYLVLEGMVIGAYAIGATEGYIYTRAEYPLAIERLEVALDRMREHGFLGEDILGSGFNFDMRIKQGAGAFVCGEETALMYSIEGKRGMPRPRPPFPATSGVWGKPSNINNVESWADVARILDQGADWYASFGTEKSRGTKTFSLAGNVKRTGLIEVPLGIPLRQIIYDIGGGIVSDKEFKGVQSGGPSGGTIPARLIDTLVDYEHLAEVGSIMGSGGLIVMDEDSCMVDMAHYFLDFVQKESCGKCVAGRVGTSQMMNILERIIQGEGQPGDIEKLESLANTLLATGLCALGGTAPNPVLTTIRYFREEYEAHINERRCPAKRCTALTSYYILPDKCEGCGICLRDCPAEAIQGGKRMVHIIDQSKCIKCGTCFNVCPPRFNAVVKVSGEKVEVPPEPVPVKASEKG
jgi:NADH:ubiquinone oxidoreductase subunit F (NADH-binding)/(2Fe-2S) ferredoxin/Pyruvate/2-oxoacid:ferredoxin oxidoreductase delta subunit